MGKRKHTSAEAEAEEDGAAKGDVDVTRTKKKKESRKSAVKPIENSEDKSAEKAARKSVKKAAKESEKKKRRKGHEDVDSANAQNATHRPDTEETREALFLTGPAAVPLLTPAQVVTLPEDAQTLFVSGVTDCCERILHLIDDTEAVCDAWRGSRKEQRDVKDAALALEDAVIGDMVKLKRVPIAKQFLEMTLWRRLSRFTEAELVAIRAVRYGVGAAAGDAETAGGDRGASTVLHKVGDKDPAFVSFKEAHLKTITERYASDLDKMRESEKMDAGRVEFLLRTLESGANLFADLECGLQN